MCSETPWYSRCVPEYLLHHTFFKMCLLLVMYTLVDPSAAMWLMAYKAESPCSTVSHWLLFFRKHIKCAMYVMYWLFIEMR